MSLYYDLLKIGNYNIKSVKLSDYKFPMNESVGITYISRFENIRGFLDIHFNIHTKEVLQIWFNSFEKMNYGIIYNNPKYEEEIFLISRNYWVGRFQPIMIEKSPIAKNIKYTNNLSEILEIIERDYSMKRGKNV